MAGGTEHDDQGAAIPAQPPGAAVGRLQVRARAPPRPLARGVLPAASCALILAAAACAGGTPRAAALRRAVGRSAGGAGAAQSAAAVYCRRKDARLRVAPPPRPLPGRLASPRGGRMMPRPTAAPPAGAALAWPFPCGDATSLLAAACRRAVIENHYQFLKGLNPSLRFLVRERSDPNFEPIIQAEFAAGKVEEVSVKGMSEAEVLGECVLELRTEPSPASRKAVSGEVRASECCFGRQCGEQVAGQAGVRGCEPSPKRRTEPRASFCVRVVRFWRGQV